MKLPIPIYEIHSRKSQPQRTKATKEFTAARSGILMSSDVTARGIDIPGITTVVQVGMPMNPEQCEQRHFSRAWVRHSFRYRTQTSTDLGELLVPGKLDPVFSSLLLGNSDSSHIRICIRCRSRKPLSAAEKRSLVP